jgi:hypothetical protein
MSTLIHQPTKCTLCGHVFQSDFLRDAAVIGGNPDAKLQQVAALMKPLMQHIKKQHPEAIQKSQQAGGEFAGWLLVAMCFEMDTPTAEKLGADFTRWNIHNLTRRKEAHPSDERIRERVQKLFPDDAYTTTQEAVVKLLCEMRDAIEEKDRYPAQPVANGQPS